MEAPKELYIEKKGTDIRQYWWEKPLLHRGHDGYEHIKYIRSDLAELTGEDIKFIVDRYSELPIQYGPRLFEEILKQFNEQREKK